MASQEGPSQPKNRQTRYSDAMTNEYPFIKICSEHVNDHEYKFRLSCTHREINNVRGHIGRDKCKTAKKNQGSKFKHIHFNLMLSFSFKSHYKIYFINNNVL